MLTKIKFFSVFTIIVLFFQTTISAMDNHDNRDKFLTLTMLAYWQKNYLNQRAIVPVINQLNSKKNESNSFWRSLQQLFSKNNLQDIKTDLNLLLVSLKKDDSINKSFNNEDVAKCKQLWDEFLLLHNYSFLDQIIYPHHPHIESPEAKKYKKTQLLFFHPDKQECNKTSNAGQKKELFLYFNDNLRPAKPMDCILNPIAEVTSVTIGTIISQTRSEVVTTVCSLPSFLFPDYFTNNTIRSYENATQRINSEIKEYDCAISKHSNAIKQYDTAIKRRELSIRVKQQRARDALNIFSTKNRNFKN